MQRLRRLIHAQRSQAILQTYKHFVICTTTQHVRIPQRYVPHLILPYRSVTPSAIADSGKVSDVFHAGSPESPLWEFKHGNGNFKRGDIVGLREIKRRASRHALVHRDSYSAPKPPLSQPGTPAEPMHSMQESTESRLTNLEHTLYDMAARLQRSEENSQFMYVRNQVMIEALSRSLQVSQILPNPTMSTSKF